MIRRLDEAALTLVGSPFRLHGRNGATGLDCLGLVGASLALCGRPLGLPTGYRLRGDPSAMLGLAADAGLEPASQPQAGDIWLVQAGPAQPHLVVVTGNGFIHAHAGLRRVVLTPGGLPWPLIAGWRLPPSVSES